MYGVYAFNAGAAPAAVVADLVALATGAAVADLSAACNKALTTKNGAASPWLAHDAAYGVLRAPCVGGGPDSDKLVRITADTQAKLSTMESWDAVLHSAGAGVTSAYAVSLQLSAAGSIHYIFTDEAFFLAASDFSVWQDLAEIKREGPLLADAAMPCWVLHGTGNYSYIPRIKSPTAAGSLTNTSITTQSPYGTLTSSAVRDLSENLYIPLAPAVAVYSSVPVGEYVGLMVSGGYGQAGDYMQDGGGKEYLLAKGSSITYAIERR